MIMTNPLFQDFPPISEKQWKQKIQFNLDGKDYGETVVTKTHEGIDIKPFYHIDSYESLKTVNPEIDFKICETIFVSNEVTANRIALNAIERGASSVIFSAIEPFIVGELIKDIPLELEIQFKLEFLSIEFFQTLIEKTKPYRTFLNIDIIGNHTKSGNWYYSLKKDFELLQEILDSSSHNSTVLSIDTSLYQNAGATIIQQIAYGLSHGFEYLNHFEHLKELPVNINFATGSNYFFEIAKLRAFRYLWNIIAQEFQCKSSLHITATSTLRNKVLYDFNTNLLRTSSENMSAVFGGADTICPLPYDAIYHKKNEFSQRIARNQLLVLKNETDIKKANQIADGSYYIEALTKEFAEKALSLFKDIEKNKGFLHQLKQGTIQRKLKESSDKEQELFDNGKLTLVGTNKYLNKEDLVKKELELYPFVKMKPRKTIIRPIIPIRLAEKMEQERLKNES